MNYENKILLKFSFEKNSFLLFYYPFQLGRRVFLTENSFTGIQLFSLTLINSLRMVTRMRRVPLYWSQNSHWSHTQNYLRVKINAFHGYRQMIQNRAKSFSKLTSPHLYFSIHFPVQFQTSFPKVAIGQSDYLQLFRAQKTWCDSAKQLNVIKERAILAEALTSVRTQAVLEAEHHAHAPFLTALPIRMASWH